MNQVQKSYLSLNLAVLLAGITAILGVLIDLPAFIIVWWRVLITSISLVFMINVFKIFKTLSRKDILSFVGVGILVAAHWVTFYGAIEKSNASICLVCMATASFFTSFLEPVLLKQKFKLYEMGLGLVIIPGMALIATNVDYSMWTGIALGLISSFLAALFSTINKKLVNKATSMQITFLELGSAFLFLTVMLPFYFLFAPEDTNHFFPPTFDDWKYLIVLALGCTTLAYSLTLYSLRTLSVFAASLTFNLEPVYGILLAIPILHENDDLSPEFYVGAAVIILAVLAYPFVKRRWEKEETLEEK